MGKKKPTPKYITPEKRAFLMSLRKFDIVRINGTLRVIRSIYERQWQNLPAYRSFSFAILRCSWTHRPYTQKSIHDMAALDVELVGRNYVPKSAKDCTLQKDIERRGCGPSELDCCDVKGIT